MKMTNKTKTVLCFIPVINTAMLLIWYIFSKRNCIGTLQMIKEGALYMVLAVLLFVAGVEASRAISNETLSITVRYIFLYLQTTLPALLLLKFQIRHTDNNR